MAADNNKAYSVRLSGADLRRLKTIADRLKINESDLIRFALRQTLKNLAPLDDENARGATLLPVFVECGDVLNSYFDLDSQTLDALFNADAQPDARIDREDIGLLMMCGMESTRLYARLRELSDRNFEPDSVTEEFKKYLYDKYLYRTSA